ncbi:hypothetical protein [Pseudomonas frederiksbergensis]
MTIQFSGQKNGVKAMTQLIEILQGNLCGSGLARESSLTSNNDGA